MTYYFKFTHGIIGNGLLVEYEAVNVRQVFLN